MNVLRVSVAGLFGGALLLWGVLYYYPFLADDTLISLRYADRLVHGQGLTWDDYHPVEGYSNLLWTLSAAFLGWLGLDLVRASRLICTVSALGCIALFAVFARRRAGNAWQARDSLGAWLACGFFGLSADVQVWSVGGLEQTQLALLLLAAYATHLLYHERADVRWLQASAALHVLLVFTRPDSALFCGVSVLAATWLAAGWPQRRAAWLWLGSATALAVAAKHGFSYLYYHEWVPNTAYIKIAFTWTRVATGFDYWWTHVVESAPLVAAAVLLGIWRRAGGEPSFGRELAYLALGYGVWSLYVIGIGGDIFPAERHCVALTALACLALVVPVVSRPVQQERPWILAVSAAALLCHGLWQRQHESAKRATEERWEFPCALFAERLGQVFAEQQPSIAVYAAGCLGYYSRLPAVDMFGLNDWTIARHPPVDLGENLIGHEFGGNEAAADYLWERNPTFVIDHIGSEAEFYFKELADDTGLEVAKRLVERYRAVELKQPGKDSWVMLSRDSALVAPSTLGAAYRFLPIAIEPVEPEAPAHLRLEAHEAWYELSQPSRLSARNLPAGHYKLEVDLARGESVDVRCHGSGTALVQVAADGGIDCYLDAETQGEQSAPWVRSVRLTPVDAHRAELRAGG
ncbi:MAG: hypothetical protein ABW321_05160 [Polyangiales bacterium]